MNNKKTIIILILVLTIGIVGVTIAYFSNSTSIDNTFKTKDYGTTTDEDFVSPDNWLPGTTTPKTLTVTNSGNVDEAVRISYVETWTSKNAKDNNQEGDLPLKHNNNDVAIINWANTDDWTTVTENGVTYKYYKYKLAPNETTTSLLESVTFNSAAVNSSNCVETTPEPGKKVITCDSTGNGYDGATYKLRFNVETVQYNQYQNAWGTSVALLDEKPLIVYGLNVNTTSKTYETGDKHQMFAFNHAAASQTPALTDYRYIGNDPYNYVYFNCDDINNQNSQTCEIWRIIGVFDVDDGEGNWEQRIKLVRGSALPDAMKWNDSGLESWTSSSLNAYLNEEYYNNLTYSSRAMIEEAKYYLAGTEYKFNESNNPYGTAEEIYIWERGTKLSNLAPYIAPMRINWIGNISLMYPSDMYLTYAYGVYDRCFDNPSQCNPSSDILSSPAASWIYEGNKLEGESSKINIWFLSHRTDLNGSVLYAGQGSWLDYVSPKGYNNGVRPVLYLSSNVKITSGTGEENNPFKLGL